MKVKTLILLGICMVGIAMYSMSKAKTAQAKRLFEKIMFSLYRVKKVGISGPFNSWITLDFSLTNPTSEDFYINTNGAIQIKVMRMYLMGRQIGYATIPELYQIDLRAGQKAILEDVKIELSNIDIGSELFNSIAKNKSNFSGYTEIINKLSFEIDIDAFGQIYTLKQSFS